MLTLLIVFQGNSMAQVGSCCQLTQVSHIINQEVCCSRLVTECPIKSITITVTNGSLGNVTFTGSWAPCFGNLINSPLTTMTWASSCPTPVPSSAVTVCPIATGIPVIIHYTITFINGEVCDRFDTLQCPVKNCCQLTQVSHIINQDICCSRLVTECPIKTIKITVTNGTLGNVTFTGPWSACFSNLTNSALTTMTWVSSCPTPVPSSAVTVCPNATGIPVTIHYTITFINGEVCDRFDTMECPIKGCCKLVQVDHVSNPEICCSRLFSPCPIKSIQISVINGTLGNVTFSGLNAACYTNLVNSSLTSMNFTPSCTSTSGIGVTVCPKATANPVTVVYVITFLNGQICEKVDKFECVLNCCQTTQVFNLAPVDVCCSRLITQCPVKSVTATVVNGSLGDVSFTGTSAGLYTGLTSSSGTSATFIASGTPTTGINMTICPKPTANPITINYVITFTNGQKCEKKDVFSCKIPPCIINACIPYKTKGLNAKLSVIATSSFPIVLYFWEFGDGGTEFTTSPMSSIHTYPSAGTYTACVTIYTNFGGDICICKKKFCRLITVIPGVKLNVPCPQPSESDAGIIDSDIDELSKIVVSPNPSSGDFHIVLENAKKLLDTDGVELKVWNLNGEVILTKALSIGESEFDFNSRDLPAGMYLVTLSKKGEIVTSTKIVKN